MVNEVRQAEIHTAETLMPEPSVFEFEMANEKIKSHKSTGIGQIPAETTKWGIEQLAMNSINLLFLFGIRKNCLRRGRNRTLYLPIRRTIKEVVVIIGVYHFCQ